MTDNTNQFNFTFETQHTEDGTPTVRYTPYTDGRIVGFKVEQIATGRVEFIYFNPSDNDEHDDVPNVFVYHGALGNPALDQPYTHYVFFEEDA